MASVGNVILPFEAHNLRYEDWAAAAFISLSRKTLCVAVGVRPDRVFIFASGP